MRTSPKPGVDNGGVKLCHCNNCAGRNHFADSLHEVHEKRYIHTSFSKASLRHGGVNLGLENIAKRPYTTRDTTNATHQSQNLQYSMRHLKVMDFPCASHAQRIGNTWGRLSCKWPRRSEASSPSDMPACLRIEDIPAQQCQTGTTDGEQVVLESPTTTLEA